MNKKIESYYVKAVVILYYCFPNMKIKDEVYWITLNTIAKMIQEETKNEN